MRIFGSKKIQGHLTSHTDCFLWTLNLTSHTLTAFLWTLNLTSHTLTAQKCVTLNSSKGCSWPKASHLGICFEIGHLGEVQMGFNFPRTRLSPRPIHHTPVAQVYPTLYRGTSLMRKRTPPGPHHMPMPRVLQGYLAHKKRF